MRVRWQECGGRRTIMFAWLAVALAFWLAPRALAAPAAGEDGQVVRPVVSLHRTPSASSEVVTQALLGETAHVVARQGNWIKVTLPAQFSYVGWLEASAFHVAPPPARYPAASVVVASTWVKERAAENGHPLVRAYMGSVLPVVDQADPTWIRVALPDGRTGHVRAKDVRVATGPEGVAPTAASIIATARLLRGTRYLWGGMTAAGIDCSGFVHVVYRLHGIQIHRDADQQFVHDGRPVERKALKPGDLVFFKNAGGTHISHVGMYVGQGSILHSSSSVSGVNLSPLSDPGLARRYAGARRILP